MKIDWTHDPHPVVAIELLWDRIDPEFKQRWEAENGPPLSADLGSQQHYWRRCVTAWRAWKARGEQPKEQRVLIGESGLAGNPISAPVTFARDVTVRWRRREDSTFSLEYWCSVRRVWEEVPLWEDAP